MLRHSTKLHVNASDFWGVVTLAVFIGLIFTLALQTSHGADRGNGFTISSKEPVPSLGSERL